MVQGGLRVRVRAYIPSNCFRGVCQNLPACNPEILKTPTLRSLSLCSAGSCLGDALSTVSTAAASVGSAVGRAATYSADSVRVFWNWLAQSALPSRNGQIEISPSHYSLASAPLPLRRKSLNTCSGDIAACSTSHSQTVKHSVLKQSELCRGWWAAVNCLVSFDPKALDEIPQSRVCIELAGASCEKAH